MVRSLKFLRAICSSEHSAEFDAFFRQPGKEWLNVECLVGQMSPGDLQAGANIAGNLVLSPTLGLPATQTVVTISEEGGISV